MALARKIDRLNHNFQMRRSFAPSKRGSTSSTSVAKRTKTTSTALTRNATTIRRDVRPTAELKRITDLFSGTVTGFWQFFESPHPPEGDGPDQRTGARVSYRRIDVRGSLFKIPALSMQTWRVILIQWKQNLKPPVFNEILINPFSTAVVSGYNIRTQPYFTVLYDKTFTQQASTLNIAGGAYGDAVVNFEIHKNVKVPVTFSSGGSVVPPSDNQFYLMVITDTAGASNYLINMETSFVDV